MGGFLGVQWSRIRIENQRHSTPHGLLLAEPHLTHQQPSEPCTASRQRKARIAQGGMMIGQPADSESGEHSERSIEQPDQRARDKPAEPTLRNRELRHNPNGRRRDGIVYLRGKCAAFLCRQAIQKEMRNHQVVLRVFWMPIAHVAAMNAQSIRIRSCTLQQAIQHCRARVHGVDLKLRVHPEQLRRKTPIAVAEDKRAPSRCKLGKKRRAATRQQRTKRQKLQPAVNLRQTVEVRCPLRHRELRGFRPNESRFGCRVHRRKSKIGVSKTKSAAARRASGVKRVRMRSSSASSSALAAPAVINAAERGCDALAIAASISTSQCNE